MNVLWQEELDALPSHTLGSVGATDLHVVRVELKDGRT
jgi:hypothetical protein